MHAVRSKARQLAWRDSDQDGPNHNPFRRINRTTSSRVISDVEQQTPNAQDATNKEVPSSDIPRTSSQASTARNEDASGNQPRNRFQKFFGKKGKRQEMHRMDSSSSSTPSKKKFTLWGQLKATLFGSWVNLLLICVPVGIALEQIASVNRIAVFVVNFLAIIPLAGMLSYATEEIALRVGETLGGLLNASFGNAVELIVSIIALVNNEIVIVKTSLIGSILSNLLLVMGMCFFFGGIHRTEQFFNVTVAQTASSLLALAVGSLIIPTVFLDWSNADDIQNAEAIRAANVTPLSRATAVILLLVYGCYLLFQLKTHATMYNEPSKKVPRRDKGLNENAVQQGILQMGVGTAAFAGGKANAAFERPSQGEDSEETPEEPNLSIVGAIFTLCASTALVGVCAEYMVRSISALTKTGNISAEFVGLILIPIVGNAAEHATAVTVAIKDKMDLAIGVAVGSSMQIALLVLPFMVVLGWILGKTSMDLVFDGLLIAVLFISVLLVNYLIQDGKSHWLEGVLLQATYIIIAVAAWYYPANADVIG